ncbi:MAG: ribonuclease HII [Chloroflexi bacterium]|nr:ribonuclease HII [Chloroflexota bacterium]
MPSLKLERTLLKKGYTLIAGVDEVGRGAWAGPVVAAAVVLPLDRPDLTKVLKGVNDSKQLTAKQRERYFHIIKEVALSVSLGGASPRHIDRDGILAATRTAMRRHPFHGDSISLTIAAASIIAKVTRDDLMRHWDDVYPGYFFAKHKGYGTKLHQQVLKDNGVCEAHRKSFKPIKMIIEK